MRIVIASLIALVVVLGNRPMWGDSPRTQAAQTLKKIINSESYRSLGRAELTRAGREALAQLPEDSRAARDLREGLSASSEESIRKALDLCYRRVSFEPVREAELPLGFPELTPIDEIQIKRYPSYRMAVADVKDSTYGPFYTLFQHIKENEIAMTAPVEMTYGEANRAKSRSKSMAFLYRKPELGPTGQIGDVEVVDVPARTTVSIGIQGIETRERIEQARLELLDWLKERNEYRIAGALRTMQYNSPMVPASRRYFEVEIPIERVPSKPGRRVRL